MHPTEQQRRGRPAAARFTTNQRLMVFSTEVMSETTDKSNLLPKRKQGNTSQREIRDLISSLWAHSSQATPSPGRSGHSSQGAAGTAAGAGASDRNRLMHSCGYGNTRIWKPPLGIQRCSPSTAYQEHFNQHVFYGAPSTLLVMEIPGCIPFPGTLQCYFTAMFDLWPNSRNCEVGWRERYKPLRHSGEDKSLMRHGWSTSLLLATEELCTRRAVWPVLLHSGATPFVAWGWESAAHNSVHPYTWSSHTTLKHWQRSFGTTLLEVLPQFCVQQPGEGPEQGLPRQPIPLPCCYSRAVQSDLL